ncbi:PLP-dependent aminotransferase family protein [Kibdelosporangium phytohabitans]|uniref:GntR family transcriptional regulator n=1 Tax=Kibdelosporangium phytohabitans TaxID=860235 RepID=A0A0N7F527_9PSEU|nr:PLP-dependent aminotransferase family protein [Kibdelosporangium phytohabitans]ALG13063.1 GntR family transcriptional regulator [Kibdelosporangium phytohabitans]MBE1464800.1 DNA-binding transcriptional MocR family regulator [Kibdelosporangium phytohabitans]
MSEGSTSGDLVTVLRKLIADLAPGERLPSSRELVQRYRVSPVTVSRAVAQLAAAGVVIARPGSGTYVAPRSNTAAEVIDTAWQTVALADRTVDTASITDTLGPPPAGTIRLDGGYLHASLRPERALGGALARAARRPDAWDRAPANGLAPLRAAFARIAGNAVTAEDVLITAGGQSALSIAFRAMGVPGSPVLMESPTYPGAIAAARAAGLRPVPVPMDADGLRPDLLAEAFGMTGARLLYCQPAHHNPTGVTLTPERRAQVLDLAKGAGAFVIEDDFARYLGHGTPTPRTLIDDDRHGTVVYLTSLTKPAAPSLRIGALVARGPVLERLRAVRLVDDFFVTRPLQEAALELISSPGWDRHLRALAGSLRQRGEQLASAVTAECPQWTLKRPAGGLHLWIQLPPGADDLVIASAARRHGVAVSAGKRFFVSEPPAAHLRLAFAATDPAELGGGVRRLVESADTSQLLA